MGECVNYIRLENDTSTMDCYSDGEFMDVVIECKYPEEEVELEEIKLNKEDITNLRNYLNEVLGDLNG